jgi:hypothetical protein
MFIEGPFASKDYFGETGSERQDQELSLRVGNALWHVSRTDQKNSREYAVLARAACGLYRPVSVHL